MTETYWNYALFKNIRYNWNMIENILYGVVLIVAFYLIFKFLQSVIKTTLIVLIIFVLIVLFKTMNEPIVVGNYQVFNFNISKIKWRYY